MIVINLACLTILGIFLVLFCWVLRKEILTMLFLGITMGLFICTIFVSMSLTPKPTAMDVYQGKTTLEFTIRDGEIVDSVVIFKNK